MASVGNWVGEITTTTGTGSIELGGALQGFAKFSDIGGNEFWYAIVDGLNKEAGKGSLSGNILTRSVIYSTLVNGAYSSNNPLPIVLSGNASVYATFNKTAFDEFTATKVKVDGIEDGAKDDQNADEVPYVGTLISSDVQAALNELDSDKAELAHQHIENDISNLDKYTQAEVDALLVLRALLNGNSSEFFAVRPPSIDASAEGQNALPRVWLSQNMGIGAASSGSIFKVVDNDFDFSVLLPMSSVSIDVNTGGQIHPALIGVKISTSLVGVNTGSKGFVGVDTTTGDIWTYSGFNNPESAIIFEGTFINVSALSEAAVIAHEAEPDPHPQYLTPEELPTASTSWFSDNISTIDGAFLQMTQDVTGEVESTSTGTGVIVDTPVLVDQWMRESTFLDPFTFLETNATVQLDMDVNNSNGEIYAEFYLREPGPIETLLATTARENLTVGRKAYVLSILIPGPSPVEIGDTIITRLYINKFAAGVDPVATLYMEGSNISRTVTDVPRAVTPAAHADTHASVGSDPISIASLGEGGLGGTLSVGYGSDPSAPTVTNSVKGISVKTASYPGFTGLTSLVEYYNTGSVTLRGSIKCGEDPDVANTPVQMWEVSLGDISGFRIAHGTNAKFAIMFSGSNELTLSDFSGMKYNEVSYEGSLPPGDKYLQIWDQSGNPGWIEDLYITKWAAHTHLSGFSLSTSDLSSTIYEDRNQSVTINIHTGLGGIDEGTNNGHRVRFVNANTEPHDMTITSSTGVSVFLADGSSITDISLTSLVLTPGQSADMVRIAFNKWVIIINTGASGGASEFQNFVDTQRIFDYNVNNTAYVALEFQDVLKETDSGVVRKSGTDESKIVCEQSGFYEFRINLWQTGKIGIAYAINGFIQGISEKVNGADIATEDSTLSYNFRSGMLAGQTIQFMFKKMGTLDAVINTGVTFTATRLSD